MFAKVPKIPVVRVLQLRYPAPLAHSNDNAKIVQAAVGLHRPERQIVACRWRSKVGGGECF